MIVVPESFARSTVEREGEPGSRWLAKLPSIVDDLLERWQCMPDGEIMHGGVGIIVPVRRQAGEPAVVKVSFPRPGNVHEPDAFAAWAGRGAVLLHERDDQRFAMLLERAHDATLLDAADGEQAAAVAGQVCRRLAIPAPAGLPRLSEQAAAWEAELRADAAELTHPLPAGAVDAAVATVRDLGRIQPGLLIHGDLHATNILRADREPWLVVDPKGVVGDPGYDAGMTIKWRLLRHLPAADLRNAVHRLLAIFAETAEIDRERARRWAQFHAVQASLWGRRHGFHLARSGSRLHAITEYAERLTPLL